MNLQHILVTGAAGAIGSAIARELRALYPSARLALVDREASSMAALAAGLGNCSTHGIDLREIDALPALVEGIAAHAPLDGLVNCAGIMRVQGLPSWDWSDAASLLAVDLLAPLRLQDLVVGGMVEAGRGLIVNIASMAGKVPLKGCAYYGASKAGLAMASEIARAELGAHGIRVITVYPGPVHSPLEQGARDGYGGGGLFAKIAPTGDAAELARRISVAITKDEPRVIYPRLYAMGWSATNFSSWITLSFGPPPVA